MAEEADEKAYHCQHNRTDCGACEEYQQENKHDAKPLYPLHTPANKLWG
jgi:hypothetical protein